MYLNVKHGFVQRAILMTPETSITMNMMGFFSFNDIYQFLTKQHTLEPDGKWILLITPFEKHIIITQHVYMFIHTWCINWSVNNVLPKRCWKGNIFRMQGMKYKHLIYDLFHNISLMYDNAGVSFIS